MTQYGEQMSFGSIREWKTQLYREREECYRRLPGGSDIRAEVESTLKSSPDLGQRG